ncbi:MAG: hypothetical protein QOG64_2074, partial [Acidimicrobiaceae bacterium]|nr:hypothetical protein [Acidimicrobiaceae bacterium]
RRRRRLLIAALAVFVGMPAAGTVLLVVELLVARGGPELPGPPLVLSGTVGAERPGPVRRALWLGDSTAAGVGVGQPDQALPRLVAAGLNQPVELTVLAISGARVDDVLRDQLPRVTAARPDTGPIDTGPIDTGPIDTVFISVGANDAVHGTRTGDFRRRYRRLLDGLPAGAEVVVLGVPDMGAPTRLLQPLRAVAGWRGRALDGVIRGLTRHRPRTTYVDIAGPTGPRFRAQPSRYFAADHYHPNPAGYRLWTDAVLRDWQP